MFKKGEVSYSKVRAMTWVATPENEAYLLMIARYSTAAQLEKLVRGYRTVKRLEARKIARRQREERSLQYFYEEDGTLVIRAKLPPDQGAVVLKALGAAVDTLRNHEPAVGGGYTLEGASKKSDSAESPTFSQRRADALVLMAETVLKDGPQPQSSAERYNDSPGRCEIEGGPSLAPDTVPRIACDSSLVTLIEDENGYPLNVGRKTGAIPPAMQRASTRNSD